METIPQEIIKEISSYLHDKTARIARVVSTEWLRWIKYSKFDIYLATSALLPQIVDRLSTYQYPIELSFNKPIRIPDIDVLENVSRLTNLKSLHFRDDKHKVETDPENYLKLSTLTNLEFLYFGSGRELPVELMQYFPRIRQCNNMFDNEDLITLINSHCPHYQSLYIADDGLLSVLPINVTELCVEIFEDTSETLTRLTNLKKLEIMYYNEDCAIDMRHVTWLNSLIVDTTNVTGLEHSHRLTELWILKADDNNNNISTLLDSVTALHQLCKLRLSIDGDVALPSLSQLTRLRLHSKSANLTLLPALLQELNLEQTSSFELSDISRLIHLTKLKARDCKTTTIEPLVNLTRLHDLNLNMEFSHVISLSTLVNLTHLKVSKVDLDPQTIKSLTHLEYLAAYSPLTKQEAINNVKFLSHLTHLTLWSADEVRVSFDYKMIEKFPLVNLHVHHSNFQNCWAVLSTLTTLEQLTIKFEDEENINSLTGLDRLSRLDIPTVTRGVTCVGLTRLTGLQYLSLGFSNNLSFSEMSVKLTRLIVGHNFKK